MRNITIFLCSLIILGALVSVSFGQKAPEGAYHGREFIRHSTPPKGFDTGLGWAYAVTYSQATSTEPRLVETKDMSVIQLAPGKKRGRIIAQKTFNDPEPRGLGSDEGGLYLRNPQWFAGDIHQVLATSTAMVKDGTLTIDMGTIPDGIAHWWTPRVPVKRGYRYVLQMTVRITGDVGVQMGTDFWRSNASYSQAQNKTCSNSNNCESWVSYWFGDTHGKFVTLTAPYAFVK